MGNWQRFLLLLTALLSLISVTAAQIAAQDSEELELLCPQSSAEVPETESLELEVFLEQVSRGIVSIQLLETTFPVGGIGCVNGLLGFDQSGVSNFSFVIRYDPSELQVQQINIPGFDVWVSPDFESGRYSVRAYRLFSGVEDDKLALETTIEAVFPFSLLVTPRAPSNAGVIISDFQVVTANHVLFALALDEGTVQSDSVMPAQNPARIAMGGTSVTIIDLPDIVATSPLPETTSYVEVSVPSANLRSGPDVCYPIFDVVLAGTSFEVVSLYESAEGSIWYYVKVPDEESYWISSAVVDLTQGTAPIAVFDAEALPQRPDCSPLQEIGGNTVQPTSVSVTAVPATSLPSLPTLEATTPVPTISPIIPTSTSVPSTAVPPQVDSDGDGYLDTNDRCPQAGPNGWNAGSDCPDSDADGFVEAPGIDQCPGRYGTINGCPDSDGDGVADSVDNCRDAAGPAENGGCPIG
jgi:hypothetical protein